jgi:ribosomal protein S14
MNDVKQIQLYYAANLKDFNKPRLKTYGILLSGGCCLSCGYVGFIGCVDQHHVDPSTKDSSLMAKELMQRGKWNRSMVYALTQEKYLLETEKCVPLCKICHIETESGFRTSPSIPNWISEDCVVCGKQFRRSVVSKIHICWKCFCKREQALKEYMFFSRQKTG